MRLIIISKEEIEKVAAAVERFDKFYECEKSKKDKPYFELCCDENIYFYHLIDNIHFWLRSYNAEYSIFPTLSIDKEGFSEWNIDIVDEKIALLFKLTWL